MIEKRDKCAAIMWALAWFGFGLMVGAIISAVIGSC